MWDICREEELVQPENGEIWRICCCADGGRVRQIQGKRFTERYEVILWKFSFLCTRVSGLTHGLLVVENWHASFISFQKDTSKSCLHLRSKVSQSQKKREAKNKKLFRLKEAQQPSLSAFIKTWFASMTTAALQIYPRLKTEHLVR